jgi:hypothetical protein
MDVLEENIARTQLHAGFSLGLLFNCEGGGDMFSKNSGDIYQNTQC